MLSRKFANAMKVSQKRITIDLIFNVTPIELTSDDIMMASCVHKGKVKPINKPTCVFCTALLVMDDSYYLYITYTKTLH